MFDKSQQRIELEHDIDFFHSKSQKEAIAWCFKHPLIGIPSMIKLLATGDVSENIVQQWRNLPSCQRYQNSYSKLESLEDQEGYSAMKYYSEQLDEIKELIPDKFLENGYYPFAGTDFYWARIFENTIFEDIGYNQDYVKNMWWSSDKYSQKSLDEIILVLSQQNIIPKNPSIKIITGDSEKDRVDNNYNQENSTLVVKGGHSTIPFLKKRFSELKFGTAVFVSPADRAEDLQKEMVNRGYKCISVINDDKFYAPYAMGLGIRYLFLKD